jgi:hypothetical protein
MCKYTNYKKIVTRLIINYTLTFETFIMEDKKGNYNSKERMCKDIMEKLFPGYVFNKIRHPKLVNPDTGRCLELDLYNAELQLAVEYNGPQHYYWMNFYHKTKDDFEKQKTRDLIKEGYCDILNIIIIEIPNLSKYDDIKSFIVKTLESRNISFETSFMGELYVDKLLKLQNKKCSKCNEIKELSQYQIDNSKRDGHRPDCRQCNISRYNVKDGTNNELLNMTKQCTKCGEIKDLSQYQKDKSKRDGHRPDCRQCNNSRYKLESNNSDSIESSLDKKYNTPSSTNSINSVSKLMEIIHNMKKAINAYEIYSDTGLECADPEKFIGAFLIKFRQDFDSCVTSKN